MLGSQIQSLYSHKWLQLLQPWRYLKSIETKIPASKTHIFSTACAYVLWSWHPWVVWYFSQAWLLSCHLWSTGLWFHRCSQKQAVHKTWLTEQEQHVLFRQRHDKQHSVFKCQRPMFSFSHHPRGFEPSRINLLVAAWCYRSKTLNLSYQHTSAWYGAITLSVALDSSSPSDRGTQH